MIKTSVIRKWFKHPQYKKFRLALFALLFAIVGVGTLYFVNAAPPMYAIEIENGTTEGAASVINDPNASLGKAVLFNASSVQSGVLWSEDFSTESDLNNLIGFGGDAIGTTNEPEASSNGHESITFHADHDLACGTPATYRNITANNTWQRHHYWCPNAAGHFMTAFNGTSYVAFGFAPRGTNNRAKIFPDEANKICIDVNITGMGNRRWWDIIVLSEATYLRNSFPTNMSGVAGGAVTNEPALIYFDPDHAIEGIQVGMDADYMFVDHEGSRHVNSFGRAVYSNHEVVNRFITDKASRYKTCLKDNGNGTVTHTQDRPGGTVQTTVMTGASFPRGNKVFIINDKTYNADKAENPSAVTDGYTLHWDNFVISHE